MTYMERSAELMENIKNHMDNTLIQADALKRYAQTEGKKELFDFAEGICLTLREYIQELS